MLRCAQHDTRSFRQILCVSLFALCFYKTAHAQDTIVLYGDTIRVGSLEWDLQKDWRAHGNLITENRELYGDHVRILLVYHRNKSASQITFGYVDKQKGFVKHGPARYYYETGQLLSKRTFWQGKLEGLAEDFYADGKIKVRTHILHDQLHGPYESFFSDGQIKQQGFYQRDTLQGTYRAWFSNGAPRYIEHWKDGLRTGVDTTFYEDGKLESEIPYEDDFENGHGKVYHRNGRQWTEWVYEKGRMIEVAFTQSKEGRPLEVGTIQDGLGWVFIYNDNGLLVEKDFYRDGYWRRTKKMRE
jgi:antitoxin component YwqK of YwqJK toxin-antitoxin module